jgi:hypothetical protein
VLLCPQQLLLLHNCFVFCSPHLAWMPAACTRQQPAAALCVGYPAGSSSRRH